MVLGDLFFRSFWGSGKVGTMGPSMALHPGSSHTYSILGGSWDLVTTYNWGYNPTYNWGNPYKATEGGYK